MSITEELRDYSGDADAPSSWVYVSIVDNEHGLNRSAFFIGKLGQLMSAPLGGNDYPVWADASDVDTELCEDWLADIAERAELRIRTAEPCDECGTPAGQRSDDFNCQCNWW